MKTLTFSIIAMMIAATTFGQGDQYLKTMQDNLKSMAKAESPEDFQQIANRFERVAVVEPGKWLPSYYAGYSYIIMSFNETDGDRVDQLLDLAQKHIDRALEVAPNESEIYTIQGLLFQARISVDYMARGMKYSQKAQASLGKAKSLNPENPRIYYLIGQNLYNTPPFAGGGPDKAHPYFKQAKEKYASFTLVNELYPDWGMKENEGLLKRSSEQIKNN